MGRGMREYRIPASNEMGMLSFRYSVIADSGCDLQAQTKRPYDFGHGRKFGIPLGRQRLIEVRPAQAGSAGQFGHSLGARDIAERRFEQVGVAIFEYRIEIGGDVFLRLQMLGGIPPTGL